MDKVIVIENSSEIKALARSALKSLWVKAGIIIFIVQLILSVLPDLIARMIPGLMYTYTFSYMGQIYKVQYSFLPNIFSIFLMGAFNLSLAKIFMNIVRRKSVENELLFDGFKSFGKAFLAQLIILLYGTLFGIPGSMVIAAGTAMMRTGGINAVGVILLYAGLMGMVAGMVWVFLKTGLTFYVMADEPELKALSCIKKSMAIMKENMTKNLVLRISFVGWAILGLLLSYWIEGIIINVLGENLPAILLSGILGIIPLAALSVYFQTAMVFFYELATGHLVKSPQPVNQAF